MATREPAWLVYARTLIGVREVPGPGNSAIIAGWLKALKAWWHDDATPWCGVFVGHVMQRSGKALPKAWYRARGWLDWGKACPPAVGAVCVLDRQGGGHVLLMTRISASALWGVGGNQGDRVCEAKFDRARVLGFRWPADEPLPVPAPLSADAGGPLSEDEA